MATLHELVRSGNMKAFNRLLPKSDVNAVDADSQTPLHIAAYEGQIEMVGKLLEHHADVNATDKNNWTAVHCAASSANRTEGHLEIVEMLLRAGMTTSHHCSATHTRVCIQNELCGVWRNAVSEYMYLVDRVLQRRQPERGDHQPNIRAALPRTVPVLGALTHCAPTLD